MPQEDHNTRSNRHCNPKEVPVLFALSRAVSQSRQPNLAGRCREAYATAFQFLKEPYRQPGTINVSRACPETFQWPCWSCFRVVRRGLSAFLGPMSRHLGVTTWGNGNQTIPVER